MAERSLADEPNEQNFARLLDIKANMADLANAEAAIEGFGDAVGAANVVDLIARRGGSRVEGRALTGERHERAPSAPVAREPAAI